MIEGRPRGRSPRLACHGQARRTIDHRFALGNRPALPSVPAKKSFVSVSSLILACSVFTSIASSVESAALSAPNTPAAPGRDLVRVDVKQLRPVGKRLLALNGSKCHLRLKCRAVVPAGSSAHLVSCHAATLAAVRQKIHLAPCPGSPDPL